MIGFGSATKQLNRVHRIMTLRIARAYRTLSSLALSVVTGIPPLDLVIRKKLDIALGTSIEEAE